MLRDARMTRVCRWIRQRVVGPMTHEEFRRMLRQTYPVILPGRDTGWWSRYGHEVLGDRPGGPPGPGNDSVVDPTGDVNGGAVEGPPDA